MLVLHANWTEGAMHLWAEALDAFLTSRRAAGDADQTGHVATLPLTRATTGLRPHPFAIGAIELRTALADASWSHVGDFTDSMSLSLRLPADSFGPRPSDRLGSAAGLSDDSEEVPWIAGFDIESVTLDPGHTLEILLAMRDQSAPAGVEFSHAMRYWMHVATFLAELLDAQRFIPTLYQPREAGMRAAWLPWLHDNDAARRAGHLVAAMPPVVRAVIDSNEGHPWSILEEALSKITDATVRRILIEDDFPDALDGRDPSVDPHVAWLAGLLLNTPNVVPPPSIGGDLLRDASQWVRRLDDTGRDQPLRLCLRLNEPEPPPINETEAIQVVMDETWCLSFHLVSADDPTIMYDADQLWDPGTVGANIAGQRIEDAQELLLTTLAKASQVYPRLEEALEGEAPSHIDLSTKETYEFLRDIRPVIEESGIEVRIPDWWDDPASRLGVRMQLSPNDDADPGTGGSSPSGTSLLGLQSLVRYDWQVAIGEQPLTLDEFQRLAASGSPLVRVRGNWVELRADDLARAVQVLHDKPGGEMTLLEAIQMAHGAAGEDIGLPVFGLDAEGWIAKLLGASHDEQSMLLVPQPGGFRGTLRPYQRVGVSWLAFLDRFGLGACLADDMGLGKTIQLIALLLHEREVDGPEVGPTLLIVPTSVMSNWDRELERFAPSLKAHLHHGPDRPNADDLLELVKKVDVIITTYALVTRDADGLQQVEWHRVVLDEAQYIKNPPTKQTQAIRALTAHRRLALTGTPVENRLSELWSIMEFCNPGYLGPAATFRRRFSIPIERHRDGKRAEQLRAFVRPLILRRLKTDPNVITDLPACVETKEYAPLTAEQAALYERTVNEMIGAVDRAEGIQRRGLVLATLVKLKQICNHPAQALREATGQERNAEADPAITQLSTRSGKCGRLITMLEEVLATGEKALIFTQFRQMGHLLTSMIEHDLDCETMFLHGGTPQQKRQGMVDRFQDPNGGVPVFILSLKAGGLGLNLTAANHVFHFDRWWNPAVENQATDRAFRIGQTRTVHVHKFVCVGTLEERIDAMIEQKTELAQNIIGAGEQWLAELSTRQLQDLLTLRANAMETDG
jgi:hypothetical protein